MTDGGRSTRAAILAAARQLFAEEGYEGATVRAITGRAGANVASVAYYFGSKEGLYLEVVMEILAPLANRIQEILAGGTSGSRRIQALLRAVFEHLWDNPDQAQLMVEIRLHRTHLLPELAEMLTPISTGLLQLVQEAQEEGVIREGHPLLFVMSLMSQPVYFMLITRRTPPGMLPANPHTLQGREFYLRHMIDFVQQGLAISPREDA